MDINIRRAVLQNMNKSTFDDVKATVDDAMSSGEEKMLPGLGVLFEVLYKASDDTGKRDILNKLVQGLQ
ncbi:small acid-soluble spore protein SspI [Mycoplasmatota bacterium]|nr:small acid-soluble spore protein SspI [Mycoplasmatota bacterium]